MKIHGFNTLTLLDYPGHVGATLFLGACNLRCPFCQNGNLVLSPETEAYIPTENVLAFLEKRSKLLDGVCISGGEPTLHAGLPDLIRKIRTFGYLVKLDTNGSNPEMLKVLCEQKLVDYVAMDIKSSRETYAAASGITNEQLLYSIFQSADYLLQSQAVDFEFRTTVVSELHQASDFERIGQWLKGCKRYFLQAYKESENILSPDSCHSCTREEMENFRKILLKTIPEVTLRGID